MKGDRLGELEELTLLAVLALGEQAYGVAVQRYLESRAGRELSLGPVYSALERLERKGYLRSALGEVTPERGGRRKRLFVVSRPGLEAVRAIRRVRDAMWQAIDAPARGRS